MVTVGGIVWGTVSDAPGLPLHCRYSVAGDFYGDSLATGDWHCPGDAAGGVTCGYVCRGVVLADNEYRHELETDIEPFKACCWGCSLSRLEPASTLIYC